MKKKSRGSIARVRTTIASVQKEMQKPRLTESVRNAGREQVVAAAKPPSARPVSVRFSDRRPKV
jgi:hypothetical protein